MGDQQTSPKCADGRHMQCEGFWWKVQDHIALTCRCWCHRAPVSNSGPAARRSP